MSSPTAATEGAYRVEASCPPYHECREQEDAQMLRTQSQPSPPSNHRNHEFPRMPRRGGLSAQTQTPISPSTRQPVQSQPMQSQSPAPSLSHYQQNQQRQQQQPQQHQPQSQQTFTFPKRREEEVAAAAAVAARRNSNLDSFTANTKVSLTGATSQLSECSDDSESSTFAQQSHPPLQIRFHPHSRQNSVAAPHSRQGSVTGLQIRTDIIPQAASTRTSIATRGQAHDQGPQNHDHTYSHNFESTNYQTPTQSHHSDHLNSASTVASYNLTPSTNLRKAISAASLNSGLSPGAGMPSPALAAMIDITPLPSPINSGELSPAPWKRLRTMEDRYHSRERATSSSSGESGPSSLHMLSPPRYSMPLSPDSPPKKKKGYGSLMSAAVEAQAAASANINIAAHGQNANLQQQRENSHSRNRSVSDFIPEQLHNVRPRTVTVNLSNVSASGPSDNSHPMHREQYLAAERGLVTPPVQPDLQLPDPTKALPSPPPSNKSVTGSEMDEEDIRTRSRPSSAHQFQPQPSHLQTQQTVDEEHEEDADAEFFLVKDTKDPSKKRKWRALRPLGQGTFSKVILATSQALPRGTPYTEANLNPRNLVAVKVVEHGPAGGADEERIEVSLKREVDILKTVSHPCIVQLKAMEYTDERALLVLTYCPGGDLFELASEGRDILKRDLVQRIFGEVVSAVRWLHEGGIVHRDLKLENVLVHPKSTYLASLTNPQSHPTPITLLTDLGLSRRIPPPPASPLLTTRCGSEDYAAPEILLGQPYDGRSTDAWALGVLLYALMEGRLPFDCPPGKIERSRVSHRVARCDWIWTRFGDDDGEWDENSKEAAEWRPAGEVVEGLLRKVRMGRKLLSEIEEMEWVKEGITVSGGLKRVDEGVDE